MSSLSDLIQARSQLVTMRERLADREAALVDNELRTKNGEARLRDLEGAFADPDTAAARAFRRRQLELLPGQRQALEEEQAQLKQELAALAAQVEALASSEPELWPSTGVPVLLFPVRLETCFKPADEGWDLLVRIYPDDLHIDSTPAPLTDREEASGRAYWQSVWPAIGNRLDLESAIATAWNALARQVDPARITLVADSTRPENAPADLAASAPDGDPRFPARRPGGDGGARAALMPDQWTVYGLRNGELLFEVAGQPIPQPLPVSALRGPSNGGAAAEEGVPRDWLVNFEKALAVGMAVSVHLTEAEPVIDQLFVLGVSSEADPVSTAGRVAATLASHALLGRLEFLPPRAPTNNSADSSSAWHSERGPAQSPDALRLSFDPDGPANASLTSRALGIGDGLAALAGVTGALDDWQTSAGTIVDALWAGLTVDWDMLRRRDMNFAHDNIFPMAPFDEATYGALRSDAAAFVRSRGPLPAIRIRRQPYGLLPVSSLDAWVPVEGDTLDALKLKLLRHLRPFWMAATGDLPRAGSGRDQDVALAGVLSQDAVSAGLVWRAAVGADIGTSTSDPVAPLTMIPDIAAEATLLCQTVDNDAQPYKVPLVGNPKATVEYWTTRRQIVEACVAAPPFDADTIEAKVQFHLATHAGVDPPLTKSMLYALFGYGQIREAHEAIPMDGIEDSDQFWRPRAERQIRLLQALERIPAADLELLTAETLDLFSHRLDAWITSLATRRLQQLRAERPAGCHLAGFGWVESLKPASRAPTLPDPPDGFSDVQAREEDTYVLAPSLHHAASAAVLRAGFDSHTDESAFGVNLVSGRARLARWIVDGVRNGQPLGALLGYWMERGLHDLRHDDLIDDVRAAFPSPIVPDPEDDQAAAALETIGARNVLDGLALYRGVKGQPMSAQQAAAVTMLTGAAPALLDGLRDLVDAVGDLVLAESVHQLVAGNPMRAGLAADTLGRGESVPSRFDVITSPRSGVGLTCSVAVVLSATGAHDDLGWNRSRPRARLAPQAEAWAALFLGQRSSWRIACTTTVDGIATEEDCGLDELDVCALDVVFESDVRTSSGSGVLERRILSRVRDRAGANASVALASGGRATAWALLSSLVKRIVDLLAAAQPLQPAHLDPLGQYPDPAPGAAAFEALVTAASASATAAADALDAAADALGAAASDDRRQATANVAIAAAVELAVRANRFLDSLAGATAALRTEHDTFAAAPSPDARIAAAHRIVEALARMADHAIDSSYPLRSIAAAGDEELIAEQARLVLDNLERLALPARLEISDGMSVRAWTERTTQIIQGSAGKGFPVVSAFAPVPQGELATGLARRRSLKGADLPGVMTWLRRVARVRPPVSDFHDLLLTSELRDAPNLPSLTVIQAPASDGADESWAVDTRPGVAQRTAVLQTPEPIASGAPICGWLVDAWTERIPGLTAFSTAAASPRTELAGLTFHYNQPDARAPHAVLIAVPPDVSKPWTAEMLLHLLGETLDLAKIRSVEHRDLPRRTPIVPVTYVLHSAFWPQEMDPAFLG
jgi:hypothetical protein